MPPVLLDTPVARESCGDAALYAARGDVAGVTNALEQLLFDERLRARLLEPRPGRWRSTLAAGRARHAGAARAVHVGNVGRLF